MYLYRNDIVFQVASYTKKTNGGNYGDPASHAIGISLPIQRCSSLLLEYCRTSMDGCGGAPSCCRIGD